jgi:hypothetical protein
MTAQNDAAVGNHNKIILMATICCHWNYLAVVALWDEQ